ncbi:MAG: chloride channel protein [Candidatus Odinarchaeota archaeon]|nr:chloride channel protein [Candidatus Odinarchaeota archaeon]
MCSITCKINISYEKIKQRISEIFHSRVFIINLLAVIVGLIAGLGVIVFYILTSYCSYLADLYLKFMEHKFGFLGGKAAIVSSIIIGALIVGILNVIIIKSAEHAVPSIIKSMALYGGRMDVIPKAVSIFAATITIGSGGSAGPEGPAALIGAVSASGFGQKLKLTDKEMSLLILCGTSAGIGAIFRAPFGGVLFGLEVLLPEIAITTAIPVFLSTTIAVAVATLFFGGTSEFFVPYTITYSFEELPIFTLEGLVFGFFSAIWIKIFESGEIFFEKLNIPKTYKPAIGAFLTGIIAIFYPQIMGTGVTEIEKALLGQYTLTVFLILAFLKMIATTATLGSGGRGGIFAPTFYIGAMLGGAWGSLFSTILPDIVKNPQAYALVGMGAFFAGASRTPLTNIILISEISGNYLFIIPLMLATPLSYLISSSLVSEDIYTFSFKREGIYLIRGHREDILSLIQIGDIMNTSVITLDPKIRVFQAIEIMERYRVDGFPIVDENGNLVGIVTDDDILHAMREHKESSKIEEIMRKNVITIFPYQTAQEALNLMDKYDIGRIPVVDPENPRKIIGIITRNNILEAYRIKIIMRRRLERV